MSQKGPWESPQWQTTAGSVQLFDPTQFQPGAVQGMQGHQQHGFEQVSPGNLNANLPRTEVQSATTGYTDSSWNSQQQHGWYGPQAVPGYEGYAHVGGGWPTGENPENEASYDGTNQVGYSDHWQPNAEHNYYYNQGLMEQSGEYGDDQLFGYQGEQNQRQNISGHSDLPTDAGMCYTGGPLDFYPDHGQIPPNPVKDLNYSGESLEFYPDSQTAPNVIEPQNQLSPEPNFEPESQLPASSSFAKLPHHPSPFDEITGFTGQESEREGSERLSLPASASHSRQSSCGGAKFVIGSSSEHIPSLDGRKDHTQTLSSKLGQEEELTEADALKVGVPECGDVVKHDSNEMHADGGYTSSGFVHKDLSYSLSAGEQDTLSFPPQVARPGTMTGIPARNQFRKTSETKPNPSSESGRDFPSGFLHIPSNMPGSGEEEHDANPVPLQYTGSSGASAEEAAGTLQNIDTSQMHAGAAARLHDEAPTPADAEPAHSHSAETGQNYQMNIYAMPITAHPGSSFVPVCPKPLSNADHKDWSRMEPVGELGSSELWNPHSPEQDGRVPGSDTSRSRNQSKETPGSPAKGTSVDPPKDPASSSSSGSLARHKMHADEAATPRGFGEIAPPLHSVLHKHLQERTLSPAATLWENPEPLAGVGVCLIPAAGGIREDGTSQNAPAEHGKNVHDSGSSLPTQSVQLASGIEQLQNTGTGPGKKTGGLASHVNNQLSASGFGGPDDQVVLHDAYQHQTRTARDQEPGQQRNALLKETADGGNSGVQSAPLGGYAAPMNVPPEAKSRTVTHVRKESVDSLTDEIVKSREPFTNNADRKPTNHPTDESVPTRVPQPRTTHMDYAKQYRNDGDRHEMMVPADSSVDAQARVVGSELLADSDPYQGGRVEHIVRQDSLADGKMSQPVLDEARRRQVVQKPNDARDGFSSLGKNLDKGLQNPRAGADHPRREDDRSGQPSIQQRTGPIQENPNGANMGRVPHRGNPSSESAVTQNPNSRPQDPNSRPQDLPAGSRSAYEYPNNPRERQGYPQRSFERPVSRPEYPPDLQERPRSRQGYPEDPYGRPRSRQGYPEEDRPRSRQGYSEDRPRSRQGYPEEDRPRSRQGYPAEDRPRSRQGYPEDPYGRPRSRQGYPEGDRPRSRQGGYPEEYSSRSRQGYPEDERPRSRPGYPSDSYNRPRSRQDSTQEAYDRQRPRQGYPQELYDRPRSQQGYSDAYPDDPKGRQYYYPEEGKQRPGGYYERPRSRQEYENSERERRGYADRHPDDPRSKRGYREDYDYKGHRGYPEEIYDRPRSRQHDGDLANTSYEESEKSYRKNSDRSRSDYYTQRNRLQSDRERYEYDEYYRQYYERYINYMYQQGGYSQYFPYQYPNRYDKGYLEEMAHYGQIPPYDPRYAYDGAGKILPGSHPDSMRGSSPGQDQLSTAADNFAREFHQGSRPGSSFSGAEPSPIVGSEHGYPSDPYSHSYGYGEGNLIEPVRQRMTPQKFIVPHTRAAFGPTGQLVHVLPNSPLDGQPAVVELIEVASLLSGSPEMEELKKFPGPLISRETHKNDVLLYCQKMAHECRNNIHLIDRESAELIWHYLELLIKQNGTVIGTDLADLLLEGHEPSSTAYAKAGLHIACSREDLDVDEDGLTSTVSGDRTVINRSSVDMGVDETTDRFRHLLLHGRKKDALDWAMKRNLWGHALFLASKMDAKTHASIMTRFANVSMKMNDPLQTLYQIMSGRQPAAVTLIADDKWGDWRPHLSVILSNPTQKAELDKRSIVTLGDTLASRGLFFGAQFCYLTARVSFGDYHKKSSKIVLLGASHSSPFEEFACNFAIQCTETYEYGMCLATPNLVLPTFQVYKFIYLLRLVDYGFLEEALKYAEVLAGIIALSPSRYPPTLAKALYNISYGLRQCDPQKLLMEETEDVAWFQQLHEVVLKIEAGSILHQSGQGTPVGGFSTGASSEVAEILGHTQPAGELGQQHTGFTVGGSNVLNYPNVTDVQGQWQAMQQQQQPTVWNPVVASDQYQYQQQWDPSGQAQMWSQQPTQFYQVQPTENVAPSNAADAAYHQGYNTSQSNAVDQADGSTSQDLSKVSEEAVDRFPGPGGQVSSGLYGYPMPIIESSSVTSVGSFSSGVHDRQRTVSTSSSHSQQHLSSRRASSSTVHGSTPPGSPGRQASTASSPGASHGIFPPSSGLLSKDATNTTDGIFQFGVPPPPSSAYTMSGTSAPIGVVPLEQRKKQVYPGEELDENDRGKDSGVSKNDKSNLSKNKDGNKSTSWIGGLFGFNRSTKPKEMILPDDKNPKIVWDKTKNRWVNVDEDPNEAEKSAQPPPPPNDADVTQRLLTPLMSMPTSSESSGNKFQRLKGRGARTQYVDVLSGSSKPSPMAPSNLLNLLPKSASMPPNVFIPNAQAAAEEERADRVQTEAAAPASTPAAATHIAAGQVHDMKAVQQPAAQPPLQAEHTGPTPMMAVEAPSSLPMMFNPSQFNQNLATPSLGSNSSHLKYGQRRMYPK